MHPMPNGLGLHSENVALAHPKVKKWLKRYYPPPPPCVYQYLMNIIQLQCNLTADVTKKMFISVHISRVFPLYLFKCKRNYLNNVQSIYSLWWSVHKYFSNQWNPDWLAGSFAHGPWTWPPLVIISQWSMTVGLPWPYMVNGRTLGSSCFLITQTFHENPHSLSFELWYWCKTMEKFGEGEDSSRLCFGGKEYIIHGENRDNMYLIENCP